MDKLIPVVVIKELSETEKVMKALQNHGINCAEITFRTACAADAIALACEKFPDMNVGAGTVINAEQCKAALAAGAKFIVSPGLSVDVAKVCKENGVPYYPGCVTPTEIMQASFFANRDLPSPQASSLPTRGRLWALIRVLSTIPWVSAEASVLLSPHPFTLRQRT